MKLKGYYTSGQFAHMANVSVRTIRFYDNKDILKPSFTNESGARFYTDNDFARLQQILLLKYLGFSLNDIKDITINDTNSKMLQSSLKLQLKLVQDRIDQLSMVGDAIKDMSAILDKHDNINWTNMLKLIHLTNMEKSMKTQYQDATNVSSRINLHNKYSQNQSGWFPWIYNHCNIKSGMRVLELGCGNAEFWSQSISRLPDNVNIVLSDISGGMLRDAKRKLGNDTRFSYKEFSCESIPFPANSFDLVIANHLLFYCNNLPKVFLDINRVMKSDSMFICSTYGKNHMKEITDIVQEFDSRIVLSLDKLYEKFGLENGAQILSPYFSNVSCSLFDDSLLVDSPEPLIEYILSCHGNQNQYILNRYNEFRAFVEQKTNSILKISKYVGIFTAFK